MNLDDLQRHWNEFGKRDPYWAIISRPDRRGNRWDLDEFFATGVEDIDAMLAWLRQLAVPLQTGRVLDFGCGVGRLTQALARTFAECDGVDIAPSMIERARELNRFGDRCRYHVNEQNDLARFDDGTFDLVYSIIVLQHIAPELTLGYLREFARVLAPGGVIVFQLPSHRLPAEQQHHGLTAIADDVCRAQITALDAPAEAEADADLRVAFSVKNTSSTDWPHDWFVTLGNHWRGADGTLARNDDGRASLAAALASGEEIRLALDMKTPAEPGEYLVELDLVIEGLTWFADRGSSTCTIPLHVVARSAASPPAEVALEPVMEVHGIPRPEVEAELRAQGLHIAAVQETDMAGGWYDYLYVATRPA